jgi:phage baseplate assembly protein W
LTARGTYIFDPDYGSDIYKYVYEPADEIVKQDIFNELENSLRLYEDRGEISYDVAFFSNKRGFVVDITVEYGEDKKTIGVTIDETLLRTMQD